MFVISINGELISEDRVYDVLTHTLARAHECGFDGEHSCSFFEVTAAAASGFMLRSAKYTVFRQKFILRADKFSLFTSILELINSCTLNKQEK